MKYHLLFWVLVTHCSLFLSAQDNLTPFYYYKGSPVSFSLNTQRFFVYVDTKCDVYGGITENV